MTEPLYLMPWSTMFPLGISAATIGIAEGALAAHLDYQRERVAATGTAIKDDPYVMYAIGEARPPISTPPARSCWPTRIASTTSWRQRCKEVSFADRAAGRRTQVRAVWRAVSAVDEMLRPLGRGSRGPHGQATAADTGVMCMSVTRMPSMSPARPTTRRRWSSLGIDPPEGPLRAGISRRALQ